MAKDTVYQAQEPGEPFRFNAEVAAVFPDMLRRSIPGYEASLEAIGSLAARDVRAGTRCYDLGCSRGAASLAMRRASGEANERVPVVAAYAASPSAFTLPLGGGAATVPRRAAAAISSPSTDRIAMRVLTFTPSVPAGTTTPPGT